VGPTGAAELAARHRSLDGRLLVLHPSNGLIGEQPAPVPGFTLESAAHRDRTEGAFKTVAQ
jgi:hypothetical protein